MVLVEVSRGRVKRTLRQDSQKKLVPRSLVATRREDTLIFNYFKCLRANVRAKVHAMSAIQAEKEHELSFHQYEIQKYIELMEVYMLS